jgi:hypothetical protein
MTDSKLVELIVKHLGRDAIAIMKLQDGAILTFKDGKRFRIMVETLNPLAVSEAKFD